MNEKTSRFLSDELDLAKERDDRTTISKGRSENFAEWRARAQRLHSEQVEKARLIVEDVNMDWDFIEKNVHHLSRSAIGYAFLLHSPTQLLTLLKARNISLDEVDLSFVLFDEVDFSDLRMNRVNFSFAQFWQTSMNNATFIDCTFDNSIIESTGSINAEFISTSLRSTWIRGDFARALFLRSDMANATFNGNFASARFLESNLENCEFSEADIRGVSFENSKISNLREDRVWVDVNITLPDGSKYQVVR
jgi:uncharacterized protein YjbI with pentapeptide repeats